MNDQPKTRGGQALATLRKEAADFVPTVATMLPKHINADRFMGAVMTAVQMNPELLDCTRRSLWNAAKLAATDGLMPDGREAAFIIRKDKNGTKYVTYNIMVGGLRKKVRNSGEIAEWNVQLVRKGDEFAYMLGDEPHIMHRPALGNRGPIVAAYSIVTFKSGEKSREVMSIEEIHAIRNRYSVSWIATKGKGGPWATDGDEMARKTVARRHAKVLPMSTDLEGILEDADQQPIDRSVKPRSAPVPAEPMKLADQLDALANATEADRIGEEADQMPPNELWEEPTDPRTGEVLEAQTQPQDGQEAGVAPLTAYLQEARLAGGNAHALHAGRTQWPAKYGSNRELIAAWLEGWDGAARATDGEVSDDNAGD